jgi:outer membrane receptor protein involved in Fe transport
MITLDLQFSYTFHDGMLTKYLDNTKLTIGGLNVLDKNPPFSSGSGNNASGYPGFLYDSTGRFLYVQLSRKF